MTGSSKRSDITSMKWQLKTWTKIKGLDSSFDPYKAAYGSMPAHACANSGIKQQYLNGHFCYAYKAGVLTNGLGIIRAIEFYDKDYFADHPEIELYKKTDAPDEDKAVGDARLNFSIELRKGYTYWPAGRMIPHTQVTFWEGACGPR